MTMGITPLDDWPGTVTRELAVVRLTPEQLGRRLDLRFKRDRDDLDGFSFFPFQTGSNDFVLQTHDHDPDGGTVILGADSDQPGLLAARLAVAVDVLGIDPGEITWRSPLTEMHVSGRHEAA